MTLDIMMPFYGSFDHLRTAVDSVLSQLSGDWRLTVLDDVYPELEPGRWVAAIDDERVRYIRNEVNLRPSRNYNKGVGLAQTEFVTIMGCDDVMLPRYVERVHELAAEFPAADIIQPGVTVIDENGTPSEPLADRVKTIYRFRAKGPHEYRGERLATSLLRGNWTYFPSLTWRTARVRQLGFRTDLDVVQDLAMLSEITFTGGSLVLDDEPVFQYRRHSSSYSAITGPDGSKFRQERALFEHAEQACHELGWPRAARAARHHYSSRLHALSELPGAIRTGNSTGRRTLLQHVTRRPYSDPVD